MVDIAAEKKRLDERMGAVAGSQPQGTLTAEKALLDQRMGDRGLQQKAEAEAELRAGEPGFGEEVVRGFVRSAAESALGLGQTALNVGEAIADPSGLINRAMGRGAPEGTAAEAFGLPSEVPQLQPLEEPATQSGRIGRQAGEFAALGLGFGLGGAGLAKTIPAKAPGLIKEAPRLAGKAKALGLKAREFILDPYRTKTGETVVRDVLLGGVGGGAEQQFEETFPDPDPESFGLNDLARIGTGVVASGVGALTEGAVRGAGRNLPGISGLSRVKGRKEAIAEEYAARTLQSNTFDKEAAEEGIAIAQALEKELPGTNFNLAQATGEAAHETMLNRLSQNSVQFNGNLRAAIAGNVKAFIKSLRENPFRGAGGVQKVQKHADDNVAELFKRYESYLDKQITDATANMTAEEASIAAEKIVNKSFVTFLDAKKRELYQLGGLADDVRLPSDRWKLSLRGSVAKLDKAAKQALGLDKGIEGSSLPPVIKGILKYDKQEPFSTLRGLNHQLNNIIYEQTQPEAVRAFARNLKSVNNKMLNDMMKKGEFFVSSGDITGSVLARAATRESPQEIQTRVAEVASRYATAKKFHETAYNHIKDAAVTGRVTGRGRGQQLRPSSVLKTYAHTGPTKEADAREFGQLVDYMRAQGQGAEADALDGAMHQYLLDDAYHAVGLGLDSVSGAQRAKNLSKWKANRQHLLGRDPRLQKQLANVEQAQAAMNALTSPPKGSPQAHSKRIIEEFTGKSPQEAIESIMNPAKGITPAAAARAVELQAGNTPEIKRALDEGIFDWVVAKSIGFVNPKSAEAAADPFAETLRSGMLLSTIRDHRDTLLQRFGQEQVDQWTELAGRAVRNERAGATATTREVIPEEPLVFDYMWGWAGVGNFAVQHARTGGLGSAAAQAFSKSIRKVDEKDIMRALERAFLDKDYARLLLTKVTKGNEPEMLRRAASGVGAITLAESAGGEE